jgi:Endomembrane protein 70
LTEEETGWKMIHGDVFRSPQHLNLFSAFVGSGAQVFATVLLLLVCVLIGVFKATKRGALLTAVILIYAICGVIGGIVAGRIFKQLKGKNWVWNVVLTASVFPVPLGIVFTWVNTIAWNRESTAALPFTTIVVCHNSIDSASCRQPFFLLFLPPYEPLYVLLICSLPPAHDGYLLIRALPSDRGRSYRWQEHYV